MIVILSQRNHEISTEELMQWIKYYDGKCIRVNGEDIFNLKLQKEKKSSIYIGSEKIIIEEVKTIFFRRYIDFKGLVDYSELNMGSTSNSHVFLNHVSSELKKSYQYFLSLFPKAHKVSSLKLEKDLNKLSILTQAEKAGLKTPDFLITSNHQDLKEFVNKYGKCIVKPMSECSSYRIGNTIFKMLTESITKESLKDIPNRFFPSFFQNYIDKKFEIRVFFINGTCYSMAIFSQKSKKTITDFRNYDYKKPNRTVPYNLPIHIEEKISRFMKISKYEIGSIDLIKTVNDEYVFLEVNLNGQYGMVSYPCNYHLNKKIASYLINKN